MRHWAPVTTIYSIALITRRMSRLRGRPPGFGGGMRVWIQFHWRSVISVGYVWLLIPQMYYIRWPTVNLFRQLLRVLRTLRVFQLVVLLPFFPFELKYVMEGRTREVLIAFRVFYVLFP